MGVRGGGGGGGGGGGEEASRFTDTKSHLILPFLELNQELGTVYICF